MGCMACSVDEASAIQTHICGTNTCTCWIACESCNNYNINSNKSNNTGAIPRIVYESCSATIDIGYRTETNQWGNIDNTVDARSECMGTTVDKVFIRFII